ncbi:MAG: bifunctional 3,4-dihydroxy-2-butanone-4-phosphate synthase/GTP cyclohydrolase II [Acidimicrobiia bacterium]|nr:bifunctional 3,4-dihydroxy-2-butanone-4-phosphate synthase/GTP cyclohydrolase II [Acidimicrobiia bacterium]
MTRASIPEIIDAFRRGQMVIITDDADRENEGDLIVAAEKLTTEQMAFLIRYTSGIICLPMERERLQELDLPQMVVDNTDRRLTAFTHSIDAIEGVTTGISASDRTITVRKVLDPTARPEHLARPGHIFPLQADAGGVLKRAGHTEAAVDLARLAGLYPAGVLSEIMNEDGSVARMPDLERFAKEHHLLLGTIADLIAYRRSREERLVERAVEARLPTPYGEFTAFGYTSFDDRNHLAMVMGEVGDGENILVRAHSECLTGDVLHSMRCDCGRQLETAMQKIAEEGRGVIVYIRGHEGRGIGLLSKLRAYSLQDRGRDTVQANEELGLPVDARDYGVGAQILYDLGVRSMRLLTNNPTKRAAIEGYGLAIVERVPLETGTTPDNHAYLRTKVEKLGHLLSVDDV